ncbi:hypothetical protein JOQ06_021916 [Pogonophryne albipinna]|uniref:Uncharacterized protein n=1 Tax=Pogonophryne albipinna TaxID=1090488 RepID=A0AAD6AA45_9TELE|nr:hypothetical protein JOQ06_021916 [Pogonophryne albipinna]
MLVLTGIVRDRDQYDKTPSPARYTDQGVYRFQPVAPVSVRLTTTVVFRCRPGSTNTERFLIGALAISCAATTAQANKPISARVNPFTLAAKRKVTETREECHRKVTTFVVKRLHPFSEVEAPTFRDMLFTGADC